MGRRPRFELLEPRAMLAITGLPAVGDRFGAPIVLATNSLGPNALTITLDDVTNPGKVTATINGNKYFNFGNSISFTGTFDTNGLVDNAVTIITPFGVDLANGANQFQWNSACDFTPAGLTDVQVNLVNADALTVQTTLGAPGGPSSIVGTFHSPTLAPPPGATLDFQSSGVISVLAAGVNTYGLSLTTTANGVPSAVVFQGAVNVKSSLNVNSKGDISIDQPLTAITGGTITVTSTAGSIDVNKAVTADGAIALTANQSLTVDGVVTSNVAAVTLAAGTTLAVNEDVTANTAVTATGVNGITTDAAADILAVTGAVNLTSTSGFVRAAGSLTATAGAVAVTAGKLDVESALVSALTGYTVTANTSATLNGPTTVTGNGSVTVTANNDLTFAGPTSLLGTGNVAATAKAGDLFVRPLSPIKVNDGTVALQAVAGTADIQAQVLANKTITLQSAQGFVLTNATDPSAEVRATGPLFDVLITNNANQILIDAPVTSQAGAVTITATLDDIVVRDDIYALNAVKVSANTELLVDGIAPGTITLTSDTKILDLTSTLASVTAGPNLVFGTGVGAAAGVTLTAATQVNLEVPIVANGAITITSPDVFTVKDALTSNLGTITIAAANGPITSVLAPITASDAVTITANNNVTLDNTITSTLAGIAVTSKAGTVTTQAGSVLAAPSLLAGNIAIKAGTFAMGNDITAGNDLSVQTATTFIPTKDFTSNAGDITIDVTGGSLDVSGSVITAPLGSVTLSAAGTVTYGTVVTGPAGSFSVTGGTTVTPLGPISVGGSITISTGGAFAPAALQDLTALTGSITVTASGALDVTNIFLNAPLGSISLTSKTANVDVGAAPNLLTASLTTGSITLAAPMGTVTVGQGLTAGKNISISSLNAYTSSNSLTTTTGDIGISTTGAGGSVTLAAAATAGNDVTIKTTGAGGFIDVTNPAAVITPVAGSITLSSLADAVKLSAANPLFSASGGVTVSGALDLDVVTPITAAVGNVTLASTAGNVFVKKDLFAGPAAGTLTINAAGEINDGTANGAVSATWVKAGNFVATSGPLGTPTVFPKFQFTNVQNAVGDLSVTLTKGAGVDFINNGTFSVSALANETGTVSLESKVGGLTVSAAIGGGASEALSGIKLTAPAGVAVTGGLSTKAAIGAVAVSSTSGPVTIGGAVSAVGPVTLTAPLGAIGVSGAVTAGATSAFTATAGLGAAITGSIFAGTDVTVTGTTAITLGAAGSTITANTGSVNVSSTGAGGIAVTAAVSALSGSIQIVTPDTLNFSGGSLTAAKPFSAGPPAIGLVKLDSGATTITGGAPVVKAGRFEVRSLGATPTSFTGANEVDTLFVSTAGAFTFDNYASSLTLTDFNPASPSIQVTTGGDLTIRQRISGAGGGRLRVVDGISCGGVLKLSADLSPLGVEFVTSSVGDNPGPLAFAGTLRDMLGLANANTATATGLPNAKMTAVFDEPGSPVSLGGTITLAATLPAIAKRITLDGALLPAAPGVSVGGIVGIDGSAIASPTATGLSLAAGSAGSRLTNAAIHGFLGTGVAVASADNRLTGLSVGQTRGGVPQGNGVGIDIAGAAALRNVVGVAVPGDTGNQIVANTSAGIRISGAANYTQVYGNTLTANGLHGVSIDSSLGTRVGATVPVQGNVIQGSGGHGVFVSNVRGTTIEYGAQVVGNTIQGSTLSGVTIQGGGRNLVDGNVVGTSGQHGIQLLGAAAENLVTRNTVTASGSDGIRIDNGFSNSVDRNTVTGNAVAGVRIRNATASRTQPANRLINNTISGNGGTALDGGVVIESASGQVVGVTLSGGSAPNLISGNTGSGIVVIGSAPLPSSGNLIANNAVTNSTFAGIHLQGGTGNAVRANVVTGNGRNAVAASRSAGIAVVDSVAATVAVGNTVVQNAVGGNGIGIRVAGGARNVIGGDLAALGNRVFSSQGDGIVVESTAGTGPAVGIVIRNNGVGIDAGNAAAGNGGYGIRLTDAVSARIDYGNWVRNNTGGGVSVTGGTGTTIGSGEAGRGNTIAANGGDGVFVDQPAAAPARTQSVTVAGNTIESNSGFGVRVNGGRTSGVTIGRAPSVTMPNGTGNRVRFNTGGGVQVNAAQAVTIIGNTTIGNVGPEIQLTGGANSSIAAPVLSVAKARVPGQKTPQYEVQGRLNYTAADRGKRFYVDIYGNRADTGSQFYLGRVLVTIAANGVGSFRTIVNGGLGGVPQIVATSTDASSLFGGTSAFSNAIPTT